MQCRSLQVLVTITAFSINLCVNVLLTLALLIQQEEGNASESKPPASNIPVITCKPSHTFMVKYYGALPVAVGTGIETVEEAAKVIIESSTSNISLHYLYYCQADRK